MKAEKTSYKIPELMAFDGTIYAPKRTIEGRNTMIT